MALTAALCTAPTALAATDQVDFWWDTSSTDFTYKAMQTLADQFSREHPSIRINLIPGVYMGSGSGLDKLKASVAAGSPPDLVSVDPSYLTAQALQGHLYIPLDSILSHDVLDSIDYLPAPKRYVNFGGHVYGVQFRTDARGLYFNQDLFAAAGLDPTKGPKDIDQLDAYSAKLTVKDAAGKITQLGFYPHGNNFGNELGWLWVFGGRVYDYERNQLALTNDPHNLHAVEWIASYADRFGADQAVSTNRFKDGTDAMIVQSTSHLEDFAGVSNLRWWASPIPSPEGLPQTTLAAGAAVAIPVGAKHPQSAAKFAAYLAQPETQVQYYRMTKGIPSRTDALMTLLRTGTITDVREQNIDGALPQSHGYPPLMPGAFLQTFAANLVKMWHKQITPQQVLDDTQTTTADLFRVGASGE